MGADPTSGRRLAVILSLLALAVPPAGAGGRCSPVPALHPQATVKLGVHDPSQGVGSGVFGGLEVGTRPTAHLMIGLTGDYFYRGTESRSDAFIESDQPYDIPVETTVSEFVSSTHLAMIGVQGRLRIPTAPGGPAPFVQGGVLAQVLHLRALVPDQRRTGRHRDAGTISDTFTGVGWHVGAGLEQPLDARVGLTGEIGYLFAEPTRQEQARSGTVTLRALASGVYARAGLSVVY